MGAPLRPVTVRDAISDLPAIQNGHTVEEMAYQGEPVRSGVLQGFVRPLSCMGGRYLGTMMVHVHTHAQWAAPGPGLVGWDAKSAPVNSLFHQVSAFQRAVRGGCPALYDHISKNMNELNLERCRCVSWVPRFVLLGRVFWRRSEPLMCK